MVRPTQTGLSEQEVAFFHEQGYLVLEDVFTDADLAPVIRQINERLSAQAEKAVAEGKLSQTYEAEDFEHRLARINDECPAVASALWNANVVLPAFFDLMRTPRLLDKVESLVGPEIIASSVYRLRPKVPHHHQSPVPWHQDSGYFEPYCDKALVLTVWLPLVEATEENGCLWVVPGAHRAANRVVEHRTSRTGPYLEIPEEQFAHFGGAEPICTPIKRGGCLFLHNLLPHASFENRTDRVRWSMDLRYQSAALPTNAAITRLPGEITVDTSDNAPVACYPPEADFLIRSRQRPAEVLRSGEQFVELRRKHVGKPVSHRFGAWS